jgi:hypothetical protein
MSYKIRYCKNWRLEINKRGFLKVYPKGSINIGMACSKITARDTPAVEGLHVHDEICDYEMSEEKKILPF